MTPPFQPRKTIPPGAYKGIFDEYQAEYRAETEAVVKKLLADQMDILEQATMCALARGETELRVMKPTQCPCPLALWIEMVDFGPAGWRCGRCTVPVPGPPRQP